MTDAMAEAGGRAIYGTALCRCAYRLAQYCDGLYRSIQTQRASPEWRTQQAVIATKKLQVRGGFRVRVWAVITEMLTQYTSSKIVSTFQHYVNN